MATEATTRFEEIAQIHRQYSNFYRLLGGGALVTLGVLIGALLFSGNAPAIEDITGYFTNLYTEVVSVILTIFVLNYLQEQREERQRIQDLQEQLVRDAGSSVNGTARSAIDEMRKRGWLGRKNMSNQGNDKTSLLKNANLNNANLQEAVLIGADLSNTILFQSNLENSQMWRINLQNGDLSGANMESAVLYEAHMEGVDFGSSNLRNADLESADLKNAVFYRANLKGTDLQGANLSSADLRGADLSGAVLYRPIMARAILEDTLIDNTTIFDEKTILPDGSYWSPECDLSEFGAETRMVIKQTFGQLNTGEWFYIYEFADGVTRRYQLRGKGWLDDKDGNPIGED